jgi:hypothetical protein
MPITAKRHHRAMACLGMTILLHEGRISDVQAASLHFSCAIRIDYEYLDRALDYSSRFILFSSRFLRFSYYCSPSKTVRLCSPPYCYQHLCCYYLPAFVQRHYKLGQPLRQTISAMP